MSAAYQDMTLPEDAKILVIRPDRIGDVVLSTPVFTSIRRAKPGWKIYALLKPLTASLLDGHPDIDEIISLSTNDKPSFSNTDGLEKILSQKGLDAAIHLFSDFWVSLATWRAGIPCRIGPASKLAQIFYNYRIRQRRSDGKKHEMDYNLDLLAPLAIPPIRKTSVPFAETLSSNEESLLDQDKNVGVFPGMGGSARNWPYSKYAELVDALSQRKINVILMGGPGEDAILSTVDALATHKPRRYIGASLKNLAAFTKRLSAFVAPSTGPLHIAGAVGTPSIGLYCPIKVCLPDRWGPVGENDAAILPDVPVCEKCTAKGCRYFDCMEKIPVATVLNEVLKRI